VFTFPKGRVPEKLDITWGNGVHQTIIDVPIRGEFFVEQTQ
jgi:hypothetical protein